MLRHSSRALLLVTMASLALLAACGKSSQANAPLASDQTLTIANVGVADVKSLDPALTYDLNSAAAQGLIYSGLVNFDPKTLAYVPDLAQDLPTVANGGITNKGQTFTFKLKPGLKFSNGDPVTAQDVAWSINRGFAPCLKAVPDPGYIYMIKGAPDRIAGKIDPATKKVVSLIGAGKGLEVVDDTTLRINISAPDAFFMAAISYPASDVLDPATVPDPDSAKCADVSWQDHAVGTGPFMLVEHDKGQKIVFQQNPNWYGPATKITKIIMPFFANVEPAYQAYKQGQADIDGYGGANITSADYADAQGLANHQLNESPYLATAYLQGNSNIAPFNNKTVRRAFAEAIDRDSIAKDVLKNTVISSEHIVPLGMPGYNANLQGLGFNPTQAKQDLLSVFPDLSKMPKVTLLYDSDVEDNVRVVERLKGDWKLYLGVDVTLKGEDFNTEIGDIFTNKIQFYETAWIADYPDPQDWLSLQLEKGAPYNTANYENPQFDQLVQQADVNQDPAARLQQYQQAEQLAVNEGAWMTVDQNKNLYVTEPWVHGFSIDSGGLTPNSVWQNVYITQH